MQQIRTIPIISTEATNEREGCALTNSTQQGVDVRVVRRDGSRTPLDISRIRAVVKWACENKDVKLARSLGDETSPGSLVNSITLEASLTTRLKDGVTTREIQDNLIDCALALCSPDEPEWRYVAGRLHIWNLWKNTQVNRGFGYSDYARTVNYQLQQGRYDRA